MPYNTASPTIVHRIVIRTDNNVMVEQLHPNAFVRNSHLSDQWGQIPGLPTGSKMDEAGMQEDDWWGFVSSIL